jgi:hypothetical protein
MDVSIVLTHAKRRRRNARIKDKVMAAWTVDEVYNQSMDTLLEELHGVGALTLRVFAAARLRTIGDLARGGDLSLPLRDAASAVLGDSGTAQQGAALTARCMTIVRRAR